MTLGRNLVLVSMRSAAVTSGTTTSTEIDMGPYINVGKREIMGIWCPQPDSTCTTDGTFDNKFQESATTVDSDFADITGAAFTQATKEGAVAWQTLKFVVTKRYLRLYAACAGTTAAWIDSTAILAEGRFDS